MPELSGASVLVAGASGGLGAPLSRLLASEGARLTLVGRDESRLRSLGIEGAAHVAADLRLPGSAQVAVDAAVAAHGRLDGVVHAAGVVAFGPAGEVEDDVLDDLLLLNTLGPIRMLRAALPHLRAEGGTGSFVVHVSAVVAESPVGGMAAYSASKAALSAFDAAAARELRAARVHLIDARPPHTETGLATRPIAGTAPRLPRGLDPDAVAERILAGIRAGERDLPSSAFAS